MLPLEVLQRAGAEITNYGGSGMSVMEMSHRSKIFLKIFDETQEKFRKLLGVPEGYKVLFLQGGGTMQFGMIPLNLIGRTGQADYAVTGHFANLAMKEAKKYGQVTIAASSEDRKHVYIPAQEQLKLNPDASYFYYCSNNTIEGTQWQYVPETGSVPLACDMSSDILSRPVDVSKFGLIFAGAQKNLAPAGVAFAIIREDMLDRIVRDLPTMVSFRTHVENNSMFNTPPVFPIYVLMETLRWLKSIGGVGEIFRRNREKAALLYDEIDRNPLFRGTVEKEDRSLMNICFVMADGYEELAPEFMEVAKARGIVGIKGHRLVGGFRASCYNALPAESVRVLVECMQEFAAKHAK